MFNDRGTKIINQCVPQIPLPEGLRAWLLHKLGWTPNAPVWRGVSRDE
jgi:hypothetical protein